MKQCFKMHTRSGLRQMLRSANWPCLWALISGLCVCVCLPCISQWCCDRGFTRRLEPGSGTSFRHYMQPLPRSLLLYLIRSFLQLSLSLYLWRPLSDNHGDHENTCHCIHRDHITMETLNFGSGWLSNAKTSRLHCISLVQNSIPWC